MSLAIEIVKKGDCKNNPHCFHGPTLLFRRRGDPKSDFYSCSASRDRKNCSFYMKVGDKSKQQTKRAVSERKKTLRSILNSKNEELRQKLFGIPQELRGYCHTCSKLIESTDKGHQQCQKNFGLTDRQLRYPTEICKPKENDKMEAQYYFSKDTAEFVVKVVKSLKVDRIICLGTPRLHEILINETDMQSILLDIDPKYHSFYSHEQFIWYNMFNNFSMDESRKDDLEQYLGRDGKLLVLMDPPFGGRVEPIAATLQQFEMLYNKKNCKQKDQGELRGGFGAWIR